MRKIKQLIYQIFFFSIYYIPNIPFICVELGEESWVDCLSQRRNGCWVQAWYFKKKNPYDFV